MIHRGGSCGDQTSAERSLDPCDSPPSQCSLIQLPIYYFHCYFIMVIICVFPTICGNAYENIFRTSRGPDPEVEKQCSNLSQFCQQLSEVHFFFLTEGRSRNKNCDGFFIKSPSLRKIKIFHSGWKSFKLCQQ